MSSRACPHTITTINGACFSALCPQHRVTRPAQPILPERGTSGTLADQMHETNLTPLTSVIYWTLPRPSLLPVSIPSPRLAAVLGSLKLSAGALRSSHIHGIVRSPQEGQGSSFPAPGTTAVHTHTLNSYQEHICREMTANPLPSPDHQSPARVCSRMHRPQSQSWQTLQHARVLGQNSSHSPQLPHVVTR